MGNGDNVYSIDNTKKIPDDDNYTTDVLSLLSASTIAGIETIVIHDYMYNSNGLPANEARYAVQLAIDSWVYREQGISDQWRTVQHGNCATGSDLSGISVSDNICMRSCRVCPFAVASSMSTVKRSCAVVMANARSCCSRRLRVSR